MTEPIRNFGFINQRIAAVYGGRTAIVDYTRNRHLRLTHAELDSRMHKVAAGLRQWGLRPGAKVAVAMNNCAEFVEIVWGCMRAGVVPVPLNVRQGRSHLEQAASDARFDAAFYERACNEHLERVLAKLPSQHRITLFDQPEPGQGNGYEDWLEDQSTDPLLPPATVPDDVCMLMYTSGSTGAPKGVPLTHRGQLWKEERNVALYEFGTTDVGLIALPMFHKNAMVGVVKPMLYSGGTMVILEGFELQTFCQAVSEEKVTTITAVPTMVARLLADRPALDRYNFSSVKYLFVGSAPVTGQLLEAARAVLARHVFHMYGMTESVAILGHTPHQTAPLSSCGYPFPGVDVRLVDVDGEECDTGELWVRSPATTPGYTNFPRLNAERIVDGWLRTGDIFNRAAAGHYTFIGRQDDMFVSGGENIYPKEVEALLYSHPDVVEACVVAIDHATKGQVPAAMVVASTARLTAHDLKAYCLSQGPVYAHPRHLLLVPALPLAGTGKVDRKAVLARIQESLSLVGDAAHPQAVQ